MLTEEIHIFDSAASPVLDVAALVAYCRKLLPGVSVMGHGDFVSYCTEGLDEGRAELVKDTVAARIASSRATGRARATGRNEPAGAVVDYERRMLDREPPRPTGVLYDGYELCRAFADLLFMSGRGLDGWLVIITNQLFGTCDESDVRYHARVSVYGHPCIISTGGMVEAPARPRSYYVLKGMGLDEGATREDPDGAFLVHGDPRTTDVLKGYLAQAVFYYLTGEPFCENENCRLYNAHWQEEVLAAQLGGGPEFCDRHERMLAEILEGDP